VRGYVVITEQPVARGPQFRSFWPNVLPHTAKNIAVEPGVHGLAFGGKFMVHNASNDEKHDENVFGRAAALSPSSVLGILGSSIAKTVV